MGGWGRVARAARPAVRQRRQPSPHPPPAAPAYCNNTRRTAAHRHHHAPTSDPFPQAAIVVLALALGAANAFVPLPAAPRRAPTVRSATVAEPEKAAAFDLKEYLEVKRISVEKVRCEAARERPLGKEPAARSAGREGRAPRSNGHDDPGFDPDPGRRSAVLLARRPRTSHLAPRTLAPSRPRALAPSRLAPRASRLAPVKPTAAKPLTLVVGPRSHPAPGAR